MRIKEYAKKMNVNYVTALRWFHDGTIEGAYQLDSGTIIVPEINQSSKLEVDLRVNTVIYTRVSSNDQRKTILEAQAERMKLFCLGNGWSIDKVVKEVGSGLNDNRKQLNKIIKDPTVKRIVVEHRDRLTRFGFNYLETLAELQGFEIIVANKTLDNDKDDLMADFTSIITSFCARLYSRRRSTSKISEIKEHLDKK